MSHSIRTNRRAAAALAVAALALAACSGGDDDAAATTTAAADTAAASTAASAADTTNAADTTSTVPATTDAPTTTGRPTTTTAPTTTDEADESSDDGLIVVESVDDLPDECRDLLVEFLQLVEPEVEGVDWPSASLGDLQDIEDQLSAEFAELDERERASGCDDYDLSGGDEATFAAVRELAEEHAPGTVAWLDFVAGLSAAPQDNPDLPTDCDGAIAYIEELVNSGQTMADIPFSESADISQMLTTISTVCDQEVADAFFASEDVANFLSGAG